MKIAIMRGLNMNPFEMQSYEPVASRQEVTGYASNINNFDLGDIRFPIKRLHTIEEHFGFLPSRMQAFVHDTLQTIGANAKLFELEKELKDKDIYHAAETFNGFSYQAARCRKEYDKKLVLTVWENIPFASMRSFKGLTNNRHIVQYVKDHTDAFIAVTERARDALLIEGVSADRIYVIPAGVDTSRFKPASPDPSIAHALGAGDGLFTILFVGRLTVEKGIYDLLYAARLASLDKELRHIRIVMAGRGPETDRVLRMIARLGLKDIVKVIGGFSYGQMPGLYNAADAFILPSIPIPQWQEQFGMVLVEAMASGLPVVSTLSGSIPEVVGDAGMLIQPNDPVSIYNAIKKLASDGKYAQELGLRARTRAVEEFDINKIADRIESVYYRLL